MYNRCVEIAIAVVLLLSSDGMGWVTMAIYEVIMVVYIIYHCSILGGCIITGLH